MKPLPCTRREFFKIGGKGAGLLAFSQYAPMFLAQSALSGAPRAEKDRTILVLVQLAGGNDGLNTVIPFEDDAYYKLRPTLGIEKSAALKVDDLIGLHPSCEPMRRLLANGKLSIVQNVGYPNPNRSHFRSMEIWETAVDSDRNARTGWMGRFFDNDCGGAPADGSPVGLHIGNEAPLSFLAGSAHVIHGIEPGRRGRQQREDSQNLIEDLLQSGTGMRTANGNFLEHMMMNAIATDRRVTEMLASRRPAVNYPGNAFGQSLSAIASLIAGGLETRVYFATLGGFDTHSNQEGRHAGLLGTLSNGLTAFQRDLENLGLADQVLTMTFSEFGRRASENDSAGTDHGTAAPLFVMGSRVRAGLFGTPPVLDGERNRDPEFSTDFRQVYATVLDRWLGCDSKTVLGQSFPHLNFV